MVRPGALPQLRRLIQASPILAAALASSLSASDSGATASDDFVDRTTAASDDAIFPAPAITITRPVGQIRLAKAGDYLGERGFEARVVAADAVTGAIIAINPHRLAGRSPVIGIPAGLPLHNARLTGAFGYRAHPLSGRQSSHEGIDLAAPMGTPVAATADGIVGAAGWLGGYGLIVELDHGGQLKTRYAHLSAMAVSPGEFIQEGQVIGFVGSTGRSTGPHLHYEIRSSGVAIDPLR